MDIPSFGSKKKTNSMTTTREIISDLLKNKTIHRSFNYQIPRRYAYQTMHYPYEFISAYFSFNYFF